MQAAMTNGTMYRALCTAVLLIGWMECRAKGRTKKKGATVSRRALLLQT